MNYEKMSREELIATLVSMVAARSTEAAAADDATRLLHDLQVHQIELEMQNRELREARSELEESRNRYADLYDFAPIAYFSLDEGGIVHDLNLSAARLLGQERERIIGRPLADFMKFAEPTAFWQHIGKCAAHEQAAVSEFCVQIGDRTYYLEATSVTTSGVETALQTRTFRTAFSDITVRKQTRAELERACASEQSLRAQIEAVDRAHSEVSSALAAAKDHRVAVVSAAILQQALVLTRAHHAELQFVDGVEFGPESARRYSSGEILPYSCAQSNTTLCFGGRELAVLTVFYVQSSVQEKSVLERTLGMYGERIASALEVARLQVLDCRERERLSILEQISKELVEHAQDFSAVERALASVVRHAVPSIARACTVHLFRGQQLKLAGCQHVEPVKRAKLESMLQSQREDIDGLFRKLADLAEPRVFLALPKQTYEPAVLSEGERRLLAEIFDGQLLAAIPLASSEGPLGVMCFDNWVEVIAADSLDVPHAPMKEKREDALGRARVVAERCAASLNIALLVERLHRAVRWRESVMAAVSHDLRSPLNTIALAANAIAEEREHGEGAVGDKQVEVIQRSVHHMENMINDLVTMSCLEAGTFQVEAHEFPARELMQEACEVAAPLVHVKGIRFDVADPEDLPTVVADRARILRVFGNLIGNAVKYTPSGGTIRVEAEGDKDHVTFSVSDSGAGISEADRQQVFERFWRKNRREHGLGLGLYIARSFVEAHGGKIWVEKASLGGAKFSFDLPRRGVADDRALGCALRTEQQANLPRPRTE